MKISLPAAVLCASLALGAHVAAVFLLKGRPLLGTSGLERALARLAGVPESAGGSRPDPLRVSLGEGELAPVEGPGPRAALDPSVSRRPPELGPALDDSKARIQAIRAEILRPGPTGMAAQAVFAGRSGRVGENAAGGGPDWADSELSREALAFEAKVLVAKLPASFLRSASLESAAQAARPRLDNVAAAQGLALRAFAEGGTPRWPSVWSDPDRPLRVPEVFVDILSQ